MMVALPRRSTMLPIKPADIEAGGSAGEQTIDPRANPRSAVVLHILLWASSLGACGSDESGDRSWSDTTTNQQPQGPRDADAPEAVPEDTSPGSASLTNPDLLRPKLPLQTYALELPAEPAACTATHMDGTTTGYHYDPLTRTVAADDLYRTFDDAGRLVQRGASSGAWRYEYAYDEQGALEELAYFVSGKLHKTSHFVNTYTDGKLTRTVGEDGNTTRTFTYDENGRLDSIGLQEGDASPRITSYRYDSEGRLVAEESAFFKWVFAYDSRGMLEFVTTDGFEWNSRAPDGRPESSAKYTYDEAGRIREIELDSTYQGEDVPTTTDGVPEQRDVLDGSCAAIIMLWPEIAHLPQR